MGIAGRVIERSGWAERNNHLDRIDHTVCPISLPPSLSPAFGIRWHLIDGVEKSAKQDEVKIAVARLEIAAQTPLCLMLAHPRPSLR